MDEARDPADTLDGGSDPSDPLRPMPPSPDPIWRELRRLSRVRGELEVGAMRLDFSDDDLRELEQRGATSDERGLAAVLLMTRAALDYWEERCRELKGLPR